MKSKYIRYCLTVLLVTCMVAVSCLAGRKEILVPVTLSFLLGAWAAPSMPWRVDRIRFSIMPPLVALAGVLLERYLQFSGLEARDPRLIWLRMIIGYLAVAAVLLLGRSTLLPSISAGLLPVQMGIESFLYPMSVAVIVVLLSLGQLAMERFKIWVPPDAGGNTAGPPVRPGMRFMEFDPDRMWKQWLGGLPCVMLLTAAEVLSGYPYLSAPPLMVALVTFTMKRSPSGLQAVKSWFMLIGCSTIGACCRWFLCGRFGLSLILCAFVTTALVLLFADRTGIFFPPSGSLAVLSMLIPAEALPFYPLQIAAGAAFCVLSGKLVSIFIDRLDRRAFVRGN